MKFSSKQTDLQQALQQLSKVTPTRSTLPILGAVLISSEGERLSLRATDLEISQVAYIPASVTSEGSVAVQHRTLLDITSEMPEGDIEFSVDDNRKVQIVTSFGSYSIMGKPVEEFPSIPDVENTQSIKVSASILRRVIDKTAYATSRDELKPSLMGVLFQFHEDSFKAVATDGHRLVKHSRTDMKGNGYQGDNILPVKFLNILHNYLVADEIVTLKIGDNHVVMEGEDVVLYTRIIDERFPDYDSVFPKDNDKSLQVNRDEFVAAIRRVSIFSNKTTHQIALRLSTDGLEITTEDVETVSTAREVVACEYKGDPLTVGYNSNYLRDLINHVDGSTVLMEFRTPVSAAVIYPQEQKQDEELSMLLMPIRLND